MPMAALERLPFRKGSKISADWTDSRSASRIEDGLRQKPKGFNSTIGRHGLTSY
jgi:hypothetical protein